LVQRIKEVKVMTPKERKKLMDHMMILMEEIVIISERFMPHDTGHLHTAVNVLQSRVDELREELSK